MQLLGDIYLRGGMTKNQKQILACQSSCLYYLEYMLVSNRREIIC